jgi:putative addiction module component (TIGR02574 family)
MNSLLSEQIMPLTVAERLQLIEEIWNSISHDESEIALTSAQQEEIERRLESYTDIKNQGKSWQEIKQKMETSALIVNHKLVTQSNECFWKKTREGIALNAQGNQQNAIS